MSTGSRGRPEAVQSRAADQETTITPGSLTTVQALGELARAGQLIAFMVWRDLLVRYKQTALGVIWVILQPLALMVVFAVFLGNLAKVSSDGYPYALFVYSGLILWSLFSQAFVSSSTSIVNNGQLVSKVYFQRLVLPVASLGSHLADFIVPFLLLLILLPVYDYPLRPTILLAPLFVSLAAVSALGVGTLLASINVRFRDVGHALPFLAQVWMFMTPVVYPVSLVPEQWRTLYSVNPMVGAVAGFRWAVLGSAAPDVAPFAISCAVAAVILVVGVRRFVVAEATFADLL